jgi:hypothetical protein
MTHTAPGCVAMLASASGLAIQAGRVRHGHAVHLRQPGRLGRQDCASRAVGRHARGIVAHVRAQVQAAAALPVTIHPG